VWLKSDGIILPVINAGWQLLTDDTFRSKAENKNIKTAGEKQ